MDRTAAPQSSRKLRILLLEDSALDAELVTEALSSSGLTVAVERVILEEEFVGALRGESWDLVLADYLLPGFDGLNALALVREHFPELPFVFVSGALGEEVAVEALKRGATDYVLKERLDRLPVTVLRALAEARERTEKRQAQEALQKLLDERTALLHELDHRVKNNLQLLLSLIGIEIRYAEDEATGRVLERMRGRLKALGAAHRDLYDGHGSSRFDAGSFARGLCEELTASIAHVTITPEFDVEVIEVGAAKAAPMALLFNEIVVNALTHAFRGRHGKLKLAMRVRDSQLLFQLSDDAFSPEEKQAAQEGASGTVLKGLARQLDASVEWPEDDPEVLVRVFMPVQEVGWHG
ncbi:MAG TPA: histidine kinase dimerization/phosphoacceptor domain -containing protein [Microvirga sp.]|nr:histidine kinase dimerization/phosphoacceptor domain -containing protein [Microvirga sp.]